MPCLLLRLWLGCFWSVSHQAAPSSQDAGVRVGTAAVELVAEDAMVIAGGIHAGQAKGQEGLLRAVAMVLEKDQTKVVMVSLDVLMMTRHVLDPILADIQEECGISPEQVMIHCTHTHHAPSTLRLHDYQADPRFIARCIGRLFRRSSKPMRRFPKIRLRLFSVWEGKKRLEGTAVRCSPMVPFTGLDDASLSDLRGHLTPSCP